MPKTDREALMKAASEKKTRNRFKFFGNLFRSPGAARPRKSANTFIESPIK